MGANRQRTKSSGMVYIIYIINGIYMGYMGALTQMCFVTQPLLGACWQGWPCCQLENLLVVPETKPLQASNKRRIERKLTIHSLIIIRDVLI